jgi:subtilisin family serine protease
MPVLLLCAVVAWSSAVAHISQAHAAGKTVLAAARAAVGARTSKDAFLADVRRVVRAYPKQAPDAIRNAILNRPDAANDIAMAGLQAAPDQAPQILEAARTFTKNLPAADPATVRRLRAAHKSGRQAFYDEIAAAVEANPDTFLSTYDAAVKIGGKDPNAALSAANGLVKGGKIDVVNLNAQTTTIPTSGFPIGTTSLIALGALGIGGAIIGFTATGAGAGGASGPVQITPEFDVNYGLASINAQVAYSRGWIGTGTRIAIFDNGFYMAHPEFTGKFFAPLDPVDLDNIPEKDPLDFTHGTHVAGIVAGARNDLGSHGVAYGATIIPVRVGDVFGIDTSDAVLGTALDHAIANGAAVINNSWGTSDFDTVTLFDGTFDVIGPSSAVDGGFTPAVLAKWQNAGAAGIISVFAAGNEGFNSATGRVPVYDTGSGNFVRFATSVEVGAASAIFSADQPSQESVLPLNQPGAITGLWIAVVATDRNNLIASFSNGCGVARNFCLAAPGDQIVSSVEPADSASGYGILSGTSMAAPHVAGAIAVLRQAFPSLTPTQIVDLLFTTATDLGAAGIDDVYGRGLLNLAQATVPAGVMRLATAGGPAASTATVPASGIALGAAFGDALSKSSLALGAFDDYDRVYQVNLRDFIAQAPRENFDTRFGRFTERTETRTIRAGTQTIAFNIASVSRDGVVSRFSDAGGQGPAKDVTSAFLRLSGDGAEYTMSYKHDPARMFSGGAGDLHETGLLGSRHALVNPFFSFFESGYAWSMSQDYGKYGSFRVGFLGTQGSDENANTPAGAATGTLVEHSMALGKRVRVGLQAGAMRESGTLLGSRLDGGFGDRPAATTSFGAVRIEARLTDTIRLFGSYSRGVSTLDLSGGAVLSEVSLLSAESFSGGLIGTNLLRRRDRWGLVATQPLRISSGSATFNYTSGYTAGGDYAVSSDSAALTPSGRQVDFELFYGMDFGTAASIDATVGYSLQPGHAADAGGETYGIAKLRVPF